MTEFDKAARAGLTVLIILQVVMLAALFADVSPHPPRAIPLFAMAPFLAASMGAAAAALILGPRASIAGRATMLLAAAGGLLSYGPQKWLDPAIGEIWPAVLAGQIAAIVCVAAALLPSRQTRNHA